MTKSSERARRMLGRLRYLVNRLRRYWPIYVATLILAGTAGMATRRLLPPLYKSQVVLAYRELVPIAALLDRDSPVESPRQRGARFHEMALARSNLERLIDKHGLYPDIISSRGKVEAVDQMLKDVTFTVSEDTFAIAFVYPQAELVQHVTAELAESLIDRSARHRLETSASTLDFLAAQREKTKKELFAKEQALAEFLAAHPEFAQDATLHGGLSPAGASIRAAMRAQERKAASASPAIGALERQRERIVNRIDQANAEPGALPPKPEDDPELSRTLDSALREYDSANRQLAELSARYTAAHPDVRHAQGRLATASVAVDAARAALRVERRALLEAAPTLPPVTDAERATLRQQLARVDAGLATARARAKQGAPDAKGSDDGSSWIVELETAWAALNREVFEVRDRYQQIEQRLFQASILDHIEASGGAAQMSVVDPAYLPERPSRRGPYRTMATAALIVLVLGALLVMLLVHLDDRIYDLEDLKRLELEGMAHELPPALAGGIHG